MGWLYGVEDTDQPYQPGAGLGARKCGSRNVENSQHSDKSNINEELLALSEIFS